MLESNIKELQSNLLAHEITNSSQSNPSPDNAGMGIEETKNSPLGTTSRKRKIVSICNKVVTDLRDVLEQHHESLGCVLGNYFLFNCDEKKEFVQDTFSEIVDLVMEAEKSKKGLADLLHPESYNRLLKSMRVPDWVLLYFKLQAQLPDSAWQCLLNLTQLGRGGVCNMF